MWNFFSGKTRKVRPLLLTHTLLSSLFSSGLIRRGFIPSSTGTPTSDKTPIASFSPVPHWVFNEKITVQMPKEIHFRRGYILTKNTNELYFGEGVKRSLIKHEIPLTLDQLHSLFHSNLILRGHNHRLTDMTSQSTIPRVRPVDTVLQSTPSKITLTDTDLRKGFGFRNTSSIARKLHTFTTNNFSLTNSDSPDIIDLGEIATIDKSKRNTTPLALPQNFGDMIHCDILYGSNTSIKGFRYALYFIDKALSYRDIQLRVKCKIVPGLVPHKMLMTR